MFSVFGDEVRIIGAVCGVMAVAGEHLILRTGGRRRRGQHGGSGLTGPVCPTCRTYEVPSSQQWELFVPLE